MRSWLHVVFKARGSSWSLATAILHVSCHTKCHAPRNISRAFGTSAARLAPATRIAGDLEKRITSIPIERFRNFCIVAHVDHGKSTLSDRLLEITGTIEPGGKKQFLDKLDVERERGITVKAQTCSMIYKYRGKDYLLHLVDTPGHVDFRAEVSRSYASCGGAILLVDASQGVQAQTVANFYLAFSEGLELLPVINKVDLPSADPQRTITQIKETFELDVENAVLVSAKTGLNVEAVLPAVIEKIPAQALPMKFFCCVLTNKSQSCRRSFQTTASITCGLVVLELQGGHSARSCIRWNHQSWGPCHFVRYRVEIHCGRGGYHVS